MSARNWTYCPQCIANAVAKQQAADRKAEESYGKVSAEEYGALLAVADNQEQETLREDYEIGVDGLGVFTISYGCSCETCGYEFTFERKNVQTGVGESP